MNEAPPEPLTKTSGQRRNSYPKLKLKPLTLTLNRNCYSHKSYLNTQSPKPVTFTLSKVTDKLYLGSENDVRSLTDNEVNEKCIKRVLSVQQRGVENFECHPVSKNRKAVTVDLPVFKNASTESQNPEFRVQNSKKSQKTETTAETLEKTVLKDKFKNIQFMHVKAADVTSTNLIDDFEKCIDFIDSQDGATIVHCQAGISRSATVCLAYLMKKKGYNLDEAFDFLKSCRSCIGPNFGFLGQLKIFEQQLKQESIDQKRL